MRRMLLSLALLGLLTGAACWNLKRVDALTGEIEGLTQIALRCMEAEDAPTALSSVENAVRLWEEAEGYTHIFLRHSEIDGAADALYALKEAVLLGEGESAAALGEMLIYHLESIRTMEHVSVGSIF